MHHIALHCTALFCPLLYCTVLDYGEIFWDKMDTINSRCSCANINIPYCEALSSRSATLHTWYIIQCMKRTPGWIYITINKGLGQIISSCFRLKWFATGQKQWSYSDIQAFQSTKGAASSYSFAMQLPLGQFIDIESIKESNAVVYRKKGRGSIGFHWVLWGFLGLRMIQRVSEGLRSM